MDPSEYPARAARQDPAQHPARVARQWSPPTPEYLASGSRQVSHQCSPPASGPRRVSHQSSLPVDPAEHPAQYPLPVDPAEYPASIKPERHASIRQWIPPVSRQSSSPVWFCLLSKRADGNLESKSLGCGGICCNGRKLVSVEGGDCSK